MPDDDASRARKEFAASAGSPWDLRQIRYFVAAYEERSFSKAARRENCTQPGLSVQIQALEAGLDQPLFERNARGVAPTPAGRLFYECCMDVLGSVRAAKQRMLDLQGSIAGVVRAGVPPSMSKTALPLMLPRFLEAHPHTEVRLFEAYSGTLSEWVAAGRIDFAIVTEPPADLGLETTRFFRDRLVLVSARAAAPQRAHRRGAAAQDLAARKLVLPSPLHSLRRIIEQQALSGKRFSGRILEFDGLVGTMELVRRSEWATILPVIAVADEVRAGRLQAEPILGLDLALDYFLVQTKELPLSVAGRDLLDALARELRDIARAYGPRALQQPRQKRTRAA